ncbi:MAG: protoporphyrinogen oxidase HemJ [Rhodobacteraceae bacterium]|nr:protoporphyrinogen oxidase HemJ [Paracoccaceae bacterium]
MLSAVYPWIKAIHIMAVIAWMAGLFYLPRLFVYHAERGTDAEEPRRSFVIMEEKLLRVIMNPAMIVAWAAGLALAATPGVLAWSMVWVWLKLAAIIGMTWFHIWLARQRRLMASGTPPHSGGFYRAMNEVPTVLMVVIVLAVVVKF